MRNATLDTEKKSEKFFEVDAGSGEGRCVVCDIKKMFLSSLCDYGRLASENGTRSGGMCPNGLRLAVAPRLVFSEGKVWATLSRRRRLVRSTIPWKPVTPLGLRFTRISVGLSPTG